jgi:hypothetical protein
LTGRFDRTTTHVVEVPCHATASQEVSIAATGSTATPKVAGIEVRNCLVPDSRAGGRVISHTTVVGAAVGVQRQQSQTSACYRSSQQKRRSKWRIGPGPLAGGAPRVTAIGGLYQGQFWTITRPRGLFYLVGDGRNAVGRTCLIPVSAGGTANAKAADDFRAMLDGNASGVSEDIR